MRSLKNHRKRLFFIWITVVLMVALGFYVTHETLHHEDYETALIIVFGVAAFLWHYGKDVLPSKEKPYQHLKESRLSGTVK